MTDLDSIVLGSRCSIQIDDGSTLDTTSVANFKVTSDAETTTLKVYGTMNAAKVSMQANGE